MSNCVYTSIFIEMLSRSKIVGSEDMLNVPQLSAALDS